MHASAPEGPFETNFARHFGVEALVGSSRAVKKGDVDMHMAGTASLTGFGLRSAAAQVQSAPRPIRRSERYDDSFIAERKRFKWPGNNTLAVWFAPNVEVWQYDSAFGVGITPKPHQLRAGRLQLRLAGIWDPRGPV